MKFYGSNGIVLTITKAQARGAHHQGQCDADVRALSELPAIRRQLAKLTAAEVRAELAPYGAWDDAELSDHAQNLQRLLWLACGDITEQPHPA